MPDWSITITKPSGGPTQFSPDPLEATEADIVSWANETGETHQIAIEGGFITDPIESFIGSPPPGRTNSIGGWASRLSGGPDTETTSS